MKRNKYISLLLIFCFSLCLFCCGKEESVEEGGSFLYYMNDEETGLVKREYTIGDGEVLEEAEDMLNALREEPEDIEQSSAIPKDVHILGVALSGERLSIDLSRDYEEMQTLEKTLMRAAVVQSLVQLDKVEAVGFSVEGDPLCDERGRLIGYQNAEDFVQNTTGSTLYSYQNAQIALHFANEKGDALAVETVDVKYSSNIPLEKLIVEQLIKGPSGRGVYPVMNPETRVLGVTIKEGICYVNLDEAFLNNTYDVIPEVAVYSLVNSIVNGTKASQVQISVNGETQITYMEMLDLSKPLEYNEKIEKAEE
ncbi:MAG: GerMN domain-containing protein [Hespellia sp.]|nr:GerMN domain-containing protein [Hespellia sp.]